MLTRTTPKLTPVPRDPQGWLCEAAKHHQSVNHESAYQLARRAGWDIEQLACPGGITDPHLRGTTTRRGNEMPMTSPREAC
jgi:hypothetical protein